MTFPDRITIRMSSDLVARIDDWIGERPDYVSRQEAIRRLVTFALNQNCPFTVESSGSGRITSDAHPGAAGNSRCEEDGC